MNVINEELLVLSETVDSDDKIHCNLVQPLEANGYSVHLTNPDNCLSAIEKYHPLVVLLPLSNLKTSNDLDELLNRIQANEELSVILLTPEAFPNDPTNTAGLSSTNTSDNIIPFESVKKLLAKGAEEFVIGSGDSDLTILSVKHVIDHVIEKRHQRQLMQENQVLKARLAVLESDLEVGYQAVQNMSPISKMQIGSFQFEYMTRPCLKIGGDSANYFQLNDGRIVFYFADVSGHGIAAAVVGSALMSLKRAFINACDEHPLDNAVEMLSWFNEALLIQGFDQHITMFFAVIDETKSTFQYSNAAHFPNAILQSDGEYHYLELKGLPLAMCETKYQNRDLELGEEFNLVMFSDGVLEIMKPASLLEKEEVLLKLVKSGKEDVTSLRKELGIDEFEFIPDDIAIFTITRKI